MNLSIALKVSFTIFLLHVACIKTTYGDFITTQTGPKAIWNETTADQLKKDLLMNYDRYTRPEPHYNTTEVKIGLDVLHVETDEAKSTISIHCRINLVWTDSKLKWKPEHYNGLDALRLAYHEIWQPDLYLYNSAAGGEPISRFGNPQVILYSTGSVLWIPHLKLTSLCEFHLEDWPYDQQECSFKFGSWTHSGKQLLLKLFRKSNGPNGAELELVTTNNIWRITNITTKITLRVDNKSFGERYYALFNITIARVSAPYKAAVVTPLYVLVFLILIQFWLPPNAKEKLFLSAVIGIVDVMYLLYFVSSVETSAYNSTKLVSLYTTCLVMCALAVLHNIAGFTLSTTAHSHSPPWIITKHLRGYLGNVLLLVHYGGETFVVANSEEKNATGSRISGKFNAVTGGQVIQKGSKFRIQGDWVLLAVAFDRIVFVLYCVVFIVVFAGYGK